MSTFAIRGEITAKQPLNRSTIRLRYWTDNPRRARLRSDAIVPERRPREDRLWPPTCTPAAPVPEEDELRPPTCTPAAPGPEEDEYNADTPLMAPGDETERPDPGPEAGIG
jgi:hypothetical protein